MAQSEYRYEAGRLASLEHRQTGQRVAEYRYDYDRNGNRRADTLITAGETRLTSYTLDRDDRLTGIEAPDYRTVYTLDAVGNRQTETRTAAGSNVVQQHLAYQYNERDQLEERHDLLAGQRTRYAYDVHGNLARESGPSRTVLYRHNAQDRLATLSLQGAPPSETTHYRYDSSGLRLDKRHTRHASRFHYDQGQLRGESNVLGETTAAYQYAAGHVLSEQRADGTTLHFLHDALRSPVRLIHPSGSAAGTRRFDAWGELESQGGVGTVVGFTGYYADEESGQYYAQQRYYRQGIGRFLSVDPWAGDTLNPITLNKYLYANGNPLIYLDPDGRQAIGETLADRHFMEVAASGNYSQEESQVLARHKMEVEAELSAEATPYLALAVPGTLLAKSLWSVARATYGAYRAGGAYHAANVASVEGAALTESAVLTGVGVTTGAEVPSVMSAPAVVTRRLAQTARGLDASLDAVQPMLRQADEVPSVQLARVADQQGQPIIVVEGAGREATSRMPPWVRERLQAGKDFNRRQAAKYPYNEVYVESPCEGGACLRLDSYNPVGGGGTGEIVSRKHTQLAEIQPQTASNYLSEFQRKYAPGTVIADVPSNRESGLAGQQLRGQMYLEVPAQNAPVPQSVIDEASRRRIIIRDEDGNEY